MPLQTCHSLARSAEVAILFVELGKKSSILTSRVKSRLTADSHCHRVVRLCYQGNYQKRLTRVNWRVEVYGLKVRWRSSSLNSLLVSLMIRARCASSFYMSEDHRVVLAGRVEADLKMICQRCLDVADVPMRTEFTLMGVWTDEQAKSVLEGFEPLMLQEEPMALVPLLEEELLLSLPIVAYHPPEVGFNRALPPALLTLLRHKKSALIRSVFWPACNLSPGKPLLNRTPGEKVLSK